MDSKPPRLLEQVRHAIRVKHYSLSTEKSYLYWIRFFIRFHQLRHPRGLSERDVQRFLTYLAVERNVAAEGPGPISHPWQGQRRRRGSKSAG